MFANDSCIVSDEPFLLPRLADGSNVRFMSLLGAIATKVTATILTGVVQGAMSSVSEAAARRETTYASATDFNFYSADLSQSLDVSVNSRFSCITAVAGQFEANSVDCTAEYVPKEVALESLDLPKSQWQSTRKDNSLANILKRANVCMSGAPKSVFEARMVLSADRSAYRLENAGYWIDSLISTDSRRARKHLMYTLEILEPNDGGEEIVLSTAWVNVGAVKAGSMAPEGGAISQSDWLRVPPMSQSAQAALDSDTAVHRDVLGHIDVLERDVARDNELLRGLAARAASSSADVRARLEQEMTNVKVRIATAEAMLDARRAEYANLPRPKLMFMPTTLRFGVTESRSEKRALRSLKVILNATRSARAGDQNASRGSAREVDRLPPASRTAPRMIVRDMPDAMSGR